jgi:hypothetical protein
MQRYAWWRKPRRYFSSSSVPYFLKWYSIPLVPKSSLLWEFPSGASSGALQVPSTFRTTKSQVSVCGPASSSVSTAAVG